MKFQTWMNGFFGLVLAITIASPAFALTLSEKKKLKSWNADLAERTKKDSHFEKKCGYELPVMLDEKVVTPFLEATASGSGYCEEAIIAMASMCEDEDAKKEIAGKVKRLECKLGKEPEAKHTLKGGTLTFEFTTKSSNLSDRTKKFLGDNL